MLIPKRVKYRKMHRGRRQGIATRGATVAFGDYGLQAMEACWMSNRQIEAARRAMTRHVKRGGQIWIRVFPDKSITKKPAETRMGSGKGNPEGWVAVVKPGRVLFEMGGVTPQVAKEAMKLAASKPEIKTEVKPTPTKAAKDTDEGFEADAPVFEVPAAEPDEKPKPGRRTKSEKEKKS